MNAWPNPHMADDPQTTPSAWGYALAAHAAYTTLAMWTTFLAIWLSVGLSDAISGFWLSFFLAAILFLVGLFTLVAVVPILLLEWILAWLIGCAMRIEERRTLIAAHRAREQRELQALLDNPPKPCRIGGEGWLFGFALGALLGAWWGDDG